MAIGSPLLGLFVAAKAYSFIPVLDVRGVVLLYPELYRNGKLITLVGTATAVLLGLLALWDMQHPDRQGRARYGEGMALTAIVLAVLTCLLSQPWNWTPWHFD